MGYIGTSITVLAAAIRLFLTIKKKHGFSADDYCWYTAAVRRKLMFFGPHPLTECRLSALLLLSHSKELWMSD